MIHAVNAERLKLTGQRSTWAVSAAHLLLVVATAALMSALLNSLAPTPGDPTAMTSTGAVSAVTSLPLTLLTVLVAVQTTAEYRNGTMKVSFLGQPRRWPVLAAKAVVHGGHVALLTVLGGLLSLGTYRMLLAGNTHEDLGLSDGIPALGAAAAMAVGAVLLTLGLSFLLRSTPLTLLVVVLWPTVLENFAGLLPSVGTRIAPWLPFTAADAAVSGVAAVEYPWPLPWNLLYFLLWGAVLFLAGVLVSRQRAA